MLTTGQPLLRPWRDEDAMTFRPLNQDRAVIRFRSNEPPSLDVARSLIARQPALQDKRGSRFWAAERTVAGELIGFCGLKPEPSGTWFAHGREIGGRLVRVHRRGSLGRRPRACPSWAWRTGIPRVAPTTVPLDERSWRLMKKCGLTRELAGDFDHPALPAGHRLSRHPTHRIARPA